MKIKRFLAVVMTAAMAVSMTACGAKESDSTTKATTKAASTDKQDKTEATTAGTDAGQEATTKQASTGIEVSDVSLDFSDGNCAFMAPDAANAGADASAISVVDYEPATSGKAVSIVPASGFQYTAIDIASLFGEDVTKVHKISFTIGTQSPDDKFYATSGKVLAYVGEGRKETSMGAWSVYLDKKNPTRITAELPAGTEFVADNFNYIVVSTDSDVAKTNGAGLTSYFIADVTFYDADGNVMVPADTSVAYAAPETGDPWEGLTYIVGEKELDEGFQNISGGGWAQNGINTTKNEDNPGTLDLSTLADDDIITVYYSCPDGAANCGSGNDMWLVAVGDYWVRCGGDQTADASVTGDYNADHNKWQIKVSDIQKCIATATGTDAADWRDTVAVLQCEAPADWTVQKVTVGKEGHAPYVVTDEVEFEDFAGISAGGWAQNGVNTTSNKDNPGTIDLSLIGDDDIVTVYYSCPDGAANCGSGNDMWLVAVGDYWVRCGGDQTADASVTGVYNADHSTFQIKGSEIQKCIATATGTDAADWRDTTAVLQCEGPADWTVYKVTVGKEAPSLYKVENETEIEDFAGITGGGWAQNGINTTNNVDNPGTFDPHVLKSGDVLTIYYSCPDGAANCGSGRDMWFVGVADYWIRVGGDQTSNAEVPGIYSADHSKVQITYDDFVKCIGEDWTDTISVLQCEGPADWTVYKVTYGTIKQ